MLGDLLHLIFPCVCASCERALYAHERIICTFCRQGLPKTHFHYMPDNPVIRMFWGRVPIGAAASYLTYKKGNHVQKMIHRLKYRGEPDIGVELGKLYGPELQSSPLFSACDEIIPVPLHSARQRTRGYNQSECFANGLGEAMQVPVNAAGLLRKRKTRTQTKKARFSRWQNVEGNFFVREPASLEGKSILLVDDVITTGATLEACAAAMLRIPGVRVNVATIASTFH